MDLLSGPSNSSAGDVQRNENSWQDSVIIIPVLLSASTVIVVTIILWKSIQRKGKKGRESFNSPAENDVGGEWAVNDGAIYENFPVVESSSLKKLELPEGWRIRDQVVICAGQYGPISRAVLVGDGVTGGKQDVVLKELSEDFSPGEAQDFVDLMRFHVEVCNHENLVKVFWCQTKVRPLRLILKAMTPGNLLAFLWRSREEHPMDTESLYKITEKRVFHMASQVASGLKYLSGRHNLVHGFVAACNVLIHEDMSVQLCGLGLAAIMHRTGSIPTRRAAQVPLKWQSPERLSGSVPTEKCDVWALGILLYEMVTLGAPPYPDLEPSQLLPKQNGACRMERPEQCSRQLYEVMADCWTWEDLQRPCLTDVMKQLQIRMEQAEAHAPLTAAPMISHSDYARLTGISL
ncbi:tyrosine-protein kinase STYK1-like [Spea bombifrons]|uniref:tyrosine-protein kinase STYK1-like n=1 Tax=Spea bombifrons TaxID=233779 RepID=UPI00234A6716|nr:tyrosine-protein kinase STYK1-like [Spea bombifrons]